MLLILVVFSLSLLGLRDALVLHPISSQVVRSSIHRTIDNGISLASLKSTTMDYTNTAVDVPKSGLKLSMDFIRILVNFSRPHTVVGR